jgi:mannan endo-1,4-beta-mannosidase
LSDGNSYCNDLDGAPGGQGSGKTAAWYSSGYQTNYIPWVEKIVGEYKNNPAVGMWEIQNEPDIKELASASQVETFMNAAAAEIKSIDPNHLVESGANDVYSWGGSCAPESSPNINVLSMHEYDYDQNKQIVSSHLSGDLACATQYNKPLIVGEVGVSSVTGSARATVFQEKFNQYLANGPVAGVNIWDYSPETGDQYAIKPGDPVIAMVDSYVAP